MAYEFKNLNEIPTQDAPTENTTVMAFESGNPRQIPAGEFGSKDNAIVLDDNSAVGADAVYAALESGVPVIVKAIVNDVETARSIICWERDSNGGIFCRTFDALIYVANDATWSIYLGSIDSIAAPPPPSEM